MINVLIIDDNSFSRQVAASWLRDGGFVVECAVDGEEGLAMALHLMPNVILMDVEMPRMNGYVVCENLKANDATKHIPIIFLSAHSNAREKLLGYEAGADDFLIKPFEPEILIKKINILHEQTLAQRELEKYAKTAEESALAAMTENSILGLALQFVEKSVLINNYESFAKAIFGLTDIFGLKCSLVFLAHNDHYFYSNSGNLNPLEKDILLRVRNESRFYDFNCRTQINYDRVSLLIKNMPLNDPATYGRIKDVLPFALSYADAKIMAIETKIELKNHSEALSNSVTIIQKTLEEQAQNLTQSQKAAVQILRNLFYEFDERIPRLGLDEDQEEYLLGRITKAIEDCSTQMESTDTGYVDFDHALKMLKEVISQQQKLTEHIEIREEPTAEEEALSGIELF